MQSAEGVLGEIPLLIKWRRSREIPLSLCVFEEKYGGDGGNREETGRGGVCSAGPFLHTACAKYIHLGCLQSATLKRCLHTQLSTDSLLYTLLVYIYTLITTV